MNLSFGLTRRRAWPRGARTVAVLAAAAVLASVAGAGPAAAGAGASSRPAVSWRACPYYSDDVLRYLGVPDDGIPAYRAILNRMECGTVRVPLDYRRPGGRKITVALTRLRAVDRAHRLGVLALNPGGPGGSGYLIPVKALTINSVDARLNQRYDLIGFDPRGVGYSTTFDCPQNSPSPPVGPLTRAQAKAIFDAGAAHNASCGHADPAFLRSLTTANIARDMDRIRAALGERRLNYLGVSWGTWLGEVYHTEFAAHVGRMFLDSVVSPYSRIDSDSFNAQRADAAERDYHRMAAWIAQHNDTYGFGTTAAQVTAAVIAMRNRYDAHPKTFTDLNRPIDGTLIATAAHNNSQGWPLAAEALKELRDPSAGPAAPPAVKQLFGAAPQQAPPPGAPPQSNPTMGNANRCDEDPSRSGFTRAWHDYQAMLTRDPVTGRANPFNAGCAGWPLPVQQYRVHRTPASVVLSGHLYETNTVYQWTPQAQAAIGGTVFTVRDDVHISVVQVPACATQALSYLNTGRIGAGCAGIPVPDSTTPSTTPPASPTGTRPGNDWLPPQDQQH
ncbi:MAG: alpha/beta fold hydrolase [Actinobacteria bacterium]|nr:alpha/beta fold hydrolase [Actinomycetota bacterium]